MKWTRLAGSLLATCAVTFAATPAAPPPRAHAKNGDTHVIGQGVEQVLDCNDATLLVNGTSNIVTAKGNCWAVTVTSSLFETGKLVLGRIPPTIIVGELSLEGPLAVRFERGNKFVDDDKLGEYSRSRWYLHQEAMKMIGGRSQRMHLKGDVSGRSRASWAR